MRIVAAFLFSLLMCAFGQAEEFPPFAAFDRASEAFLNDPHDLAIGPDGRLYVADKLAARIAILDPETLELVGEIESGRLPQVRDVSFNSDGTAAVAVTGLGAVLVYSPLSERSDAPATVLPAPRSEGALLHSNGTVYAMASGIGTLIAYRDGEAVALAAGHVGAHDVAEGPDGGIWVADNFNRRLVKYSPDLEQLQVIDHPRFGFVGPRYLDIDAFGRLIVADQDAHRILMIDPDGADGGTLIGILGDGLPGIGPNKFDDPEGVAVDGTRYFFSDSDNNRVVRYTVVTN